MARKRPVPPAVFIAAAFMLVLGGVFAWLTWVGESIFVFNDGASPATLSASKKTVVVPAGAWGSIALPANKLHQVQVAFADGTRTQFPVDLRHRPDFPGAHAYATTGRGCFALLDISAVYGSTEAKQVTAVARFRDTQVMERRVPFSTTLDPTPLPREFVWNREYATLLWFAPLPCAALDDDAGLAAAIRSVVRAPAPQRAP